MGTSINFFCNLSYSSFSFESDYTDQPLLPKCISEPCPPMTLLPIHLFSLLGSLLVGADHSMPGASHKSCSFGDALTQLSSHYNLALCQSHSNPYGCPFFLLLTHRLQGQSVPLLPNISNPLSSAIVMRYSMLFTLPVSGPNVMAERCIGPVWLLNLVIYNQVKEICTIYTHNSTLYSPSWLHHSSLDRFMWIRKFQV